MEKKESWVANPKDNVATILSHDVTKGKVIKVNIMNQTREIQINADIPYGHKVAIHPIKKGETVLKYGVSIGQASENIKIGDYIHIHNIESNRGRGDLTGEGKGGKVSG